MAIDVKQYADELLKEAGADEATRQAFLNVVSNEKVSKRLSTDVLMQADYNRGMDALKKEKDQWTNWYTQTLAQVEKDRKSVADYEAKVKAFEAQYGSLDGDPKPNPVHAVQADFLTKKDLEEKLQQQGNQMLSILEWVGKKPIEHYKTFGDTLDIAAVKKIAVEKGFSLDQAYQEYSSPLFAERQKADMEKKIADAKAEGAREFASTHKLPIDARPREFHTLFDQKPRDQAPDPKTPQGERQLANNFAEAWNSANATSGG